MVGGSSKLVADYGGPGKEQKNTNLSSTFLKYFPIPSFHMKSKIKYTH